MSRIYLGEEKFHVLEYGDKDAGMVAYPINFEEVYNLKGRLFTLIDASFADKQQRKAFKDMTWSTITQWMHDHEDECDAGIEMPTR